MSPLPSPSPAPAAPLRRLGPRLLAAIVVASSLLALLATAVQLYLDYRRQLGEIESELVRVEQSLAESIALGLWSLDQAQIRSQLDGLLQVRDVRFAVVEGRLGERFAAGNVATQGIVERSYTLLAPQPGHEPIGTLRLGIGLDGVYQRLLDRALVIFATQAAKTALVALFILAIVRAWVTRPLARMAAHARMLSGDTLDRPLNLQRRPGTPADELDDVAAALNEMSARLARELQASAAAEAELRQHRDHLEDLVAQRTADLRDAKDRAEAANRAKSAFLSRMSHELRTPLNAILGYAQLLRLDAPDGSRVAEGVDIIRASGEHLLGLIVDILDLSRIEAGRVEMDALPLGVRGLVDGVADLMRVKADEKGLAFTVDVADDVPDVVVADERRLRQVLLNLLGNAVKFTDRGQVHLSVRRNPAAGPGQLVRFEVQDSGIGISPHDVERLFEPFEQGDDLHRRRAGTGLGLAISRQLVRRMGSEIQVDSQPGEGSRFWFDAGEAAPLPMPLPTTPPPALPPARRYAGPRRRVLVADDVAGNRQLLRDLLQRHGFEVDEAADGREALDALAESPCDLLLLDMAMPVLDGFAVLRHLRADATLRILPVIAISAHASDADGRRCLQAGADAFCPKPVDAARLLQVVGERLALEWEPA